MKDIFRGLVGGLAFETTIPVRSKTEDFWKFADRAFLFPAVGALLGGLFGIFAFSLSFLPRFTGAGLFLVILYLFGGIIHSDGLADFADGLAAGGSQERRYEIMKDEKTGAAGLVSLVVTNLLVFAAFVDLLSLNRSWLIFVVVVSAEIISKETMLFVTCMGTGPHEGMGETFISRTTYLGLVLGTILAGGLVYLLAGPYGLIPLGLTGLIGMVAIFLGNWVIGGVNGDIIGASGEFVRPLALIAFAALHETGLLEAPWPWL